MRKFTQWSRVVAGILILVELIAGVPSVAWATRTGEIYTSRAKSYTSIDFRSVSFHVADSIKLAGNINLYAYCNNNPVNCVDPLGLLSPECKQNELDRKALKQKIGQLQRRIERQLKREIDNPLPWMEKWRFMDIFDLDEKRSWDSPGSNLDKDFKSIKDLNDEIKRHDETIKKLEDDFKKNCPPDDDGNSNPNGNRVRVPKSVMPKDEFPVEGLPPDQQKPVGRFLLAGALLLESGPIGWGIAAWLVAHAK